MSTSFDRNWIRSRYEELRKGALGEAIMPEARNGLVLILRCGMWRWAQSLMAQLKVKTLPAQSNATSLQRTESLIQLLATMVVNTGAYNE